MTQPSEKSAQGIHMSKECCWRCNLAKRERHWTERVWWLMALSLSIWLFGSSIHNVWVKWQKHPITLTLAEKQVPVSSIPFPTVTICPNTKTTSDKINITTAYHTLLRFKPLYGNELFRMEALTHICQFYFPSIVHFENKLTNETIYDTFEDMAPNIDDTLMNCMWNDTQLSSTQLYSTILTEEGICFTFNALNSREIYTDRMAPQMMTVENNPNVSGWNIETGYEDSFNETNYPIRVFNSNLHAGLITFMRVFEKDFNYLCSSGLQGAKVFLTAPGETDKMPKDGVSVSFSEMTAVLIKSTLYVTSEELRRYSANERECFFHSERQLSFFKSYSQEKCESECLANYTKLQCNCVKFSMPREKETKICGAASVKCYQNAKLKLFGEDIIDGLRDKEAREFRIHCNCLASCTSIKFEAEIGRVKLDFLETLKAYYGPYRSFYDLENPPGIQVAGVQLAFKDPFVLVLRRSELYTYTDFLAICGGLLSLFLGVSVLSMIEFIYSSILRLYWTFQEWKSSSGVEPFERKIVSSISVDARGSQYNE